MNRLVNNIQEVENINIDKEANIHGPVPDIRATPSFQDELDILRISRNSFNEPERNSQGSPRRSVSFSPTKD
jgi:hypothetical protein